MRNYFSRTTTTEEKFTEELADISKRQNKEEESEVTLSFVRKVNDLFAPVSQGIQAPSLWLLSTNSGIREKSEMQVSKQR